MYVEGSSQVTAGHFLLIGHRKEPQAKNSLTAVLLYCTQTCTMDYNVKQKAGTGSEMADLSIHSESR